VRTTSPATGSPLTRLARFTVRRRRLVLVLSAIAFVVAGVFGSGVARSLTSGGFNNPAAEASRATDTLDRVFHQRQPNLVLLVTARNGSVDGAAVASAGRALTAQLASNPAVEQSASYWTLGSPPPLRSRDGRQALVLVSLRGDDDTVRKSVNEVADSVRGTRGPITVAVGGRAAVYREVSDQIEHDLTRAEAIALPITLVLLIIVFGSVVAAGLPLAVGALAVVGTFFVLRVLSAITGVSIYALNLTTALGLGLAIDYSLFIVSRYREELEHGREPHDAVVRTVETAGKTVAFSALTVAVSLSALLVFPLTFLRSFAYAGVAVAVVAATGAVVTLPALLAVLGRNVDRWVLWRVRRKPEGEGAWHRVATTVMRRPVGVGTAVVVLLLILGAPFLHIRFALPDDRVLPKSAEARQVQTVLRNDFTSRESSALTIVAPDLREPAAHASAIEQYAIRLSRLDGVGRVDARTGSYARGVRIAGPGPATARFVTSRGTWLSVVPTVEPESPAGERLVHAIRDDHPPFHVLVGGTSADLVDSKASLFGRMPIAAGIIALATFVLLFMMFGGLLVPVKALVINVLSLSATFGAMVWVFQDGHLSGLLDFTPTGTLDTTVPILMFCVAFGLSMDYEVFLLSRIKEEHDRTGDNTRSVALGLERTGRIVTAAAILIAVVLLAFASSRITFIKLFGLGLALAVLMDAFVIRATLVPAFMKLAGEANWWAPGPLRRFYQRFGIHETEDTIVLDDADGTEPREPTLVR
jgi:RND superfamily putative drug exporter